MTEIGRTASLRLLLLQPQRRAGFILLKVSLILLAIVEVAYIGATEFRHYRRKAQRDQFVEEVRALAAVFEKFHAQTDTWPAATHAEARIPRGMESALASTRWLAGPPFGGTYGWVPPAPVPNEPTEEEGEKKPAPVAGIALTAFSPAPPLPLSHADLLELDRRLDDGNLATGRFRTGFNGWPVYQVNLGR